MGQFQAAPPPLEKLFSEKELKLLLVGLVACDKTIVRLTAAAADSLDQRIG
jgi:hypothetical protein